MKLGVFVNKVKLQYELDIDPASTWITATPSATARNNFIYMQEAGDFIAGPRYFTEREHLPSYLIKYVLAGKGILEYRGHTYTLKPGQFLWLDCVEHQYYRTAPDSNHWHILWVHFYGANAPQYYEQFLSFNNDQNVAELHHTHSTVHAIRSLLSLYQGGQPHLSNDLRASAILTAIMADCITSHDSTGESLDTAPDSVQQARAYLLENYTDRITLDHLSERFAIDKFYFQKLFKRHVGLSPNEFLILTRLGRAKELLRTTPLSVGEIACTIGMPNPSHFIKTFQQHEHITPGQYRQQWSLP